MTTKTWKPHPLNTVIIELLQRRGPTTDSELQSMVKEIYSDVGFDVLNKELMRLEIRGLVRVTSLARGKRRVALLADKER